MIIVIIIQFDGRLMYFLRDNWNIVCALVNVISVFVEIWYLNIESMNWIVRAVIRAVTINIASLLEYKNFSLDATLVI